MEKIKKYVISSEAKISEDFGLRRGTFSSSAEAIGNHLQQFEENHRKVCSFIGGKEKTAFQCFEENHRKVCSFIGGKEKTAFQCFEENQKKPEGCF